jgi:hypothetical protein
MRSSLGRSTGACRGDSAGLQASLMSRLDRLGLKDVAQIGAGSAGNFPHVAGCAGAKAGGGTGL